jgi:V8-like Glu-specific endopeptidase
VGNGATLVSKERKPAAGHCTYKTTKIDAALAFRARAAAAMSKKSVQEYISDLVNADAARILRLPPVDRLPPPPHPKHPNKPKPPDR